MAFNSDVYIKVLKKNIDNYINNLNEINENCEEIKKYKNYLDDYNNHIENINKKRDNVYKNCEDLMYLEQLTIGLYGEWGSGKTHILKNLKYYYQDKKNIIPIYFDPWRYEKQNNILIPLLETFLISIKEYEARSNESNVYEKIKPLIYNFIASFSIKTTIGKTEIEFNPENIFENQKNFDDINKEDIYIVFTTILESIALKHNIYFIFLIDDLDRCLPESALTILNYIKSFFDTQYCIFVIAIDEEIIEKGIEYHYRDYFKLNSVIPISGYEYLEKIITLPFRIPVINENDLKLYLIEQQRDNNNYRELLSDPKQSLIDFLSKTIPPAPRKVKRALSLLNIKFELAKSIGFNSPDKILFAKLVLLELFTPQLFRFLKDNDYVFLTNYLVKWRKQSLEEREHALQIDKNLTTKQKTDLSRLLEILKDIKERRIKFDLDKIDIIFEKELEKDGLQKYMEFKLVTNINNVNIQYKTPTNLMKFIDELKQPSLSKEDIVNYFKFDMALKDIDLNNNIFLSQSTLNEIINSLTNIDKDKKEIIYNSLSNYINPNDIKILKKLLEE